MQKSTFAIESTVLGVDACKDGWIVAKIQDENLQLELYERFSDIIKAHETVKYIFIDIPIGLPETKEEANQRPEVDARKLLPKKASSVFTVPCKHAAEQSTYEAANNINRDVLGKGISKQSYYVMKKSLEVNHYVERNSAYLHKIKESHPELQFAQFTDTKLPIIASKKTEKGMQERATLLVDLLYTQLNIPIDFHASSLYIQFPDDVLDAVCLVIAARLGLEHGFKTIPENATCNSYGIPMKMTYVSM